MDAISFVLGVRVSHLRGSNLSELIYRGETRLRLEANVTLVYRVSEKEVDDMDEGDLLKFSRSISPSGQSSYKLNGRRVNWDAYDECLQRIGILVKARNFLVFQVNYNFAKQSGKRAKERKLLFSICQYHALQK